MDYTQTHQEGIFDEKPANALEWSVQTAHINNRGQSAKHTVAD